MGRWNKPDLPEPPGGWRKGEKAAAFAEAAARDDEEREARIERICNAKASGAWFGMFSMGELAREWKLSIHTVIKLSGLATSRLKAGVTKESREAARSDGLARAGRLGLKAEAAGQFRAAIDATALGAKLAGVSLNPSEVLISYDHPMTERLVHGGPRAAVDGALAWLVDNDGDFAGARQAGYAAADRNEELVAQEMEKQSPGLKPDVRAALESAVRIAATYGIDPAAYLEGVAADMGQVPVASVAIPPALPPGERFGLSISAVLKAMPENDEDVAPWRPVLAELAVGGRDDDAAE